jgi:hypothetical protein
MCAEKEPAECHRMILVCRHLRGEDIEIKHILEDGNLEDNRDTELRLMKILKTSDLIPFGEIEDPVERAHEDMKIGDKISAGVFGKTGWRITKNCNDKDSIAHFLDSASTCSDFEAELLYVGEIKSQPLSILRLVKCL